MPKTTFSLLRTLNGAPTAARQYSGDSHVFPSKIVAEYFTSDKLTDRFIRLLIGEHILKWKEILEAFEFFDHTRKVVRSPSMAEVCCGHGLIGTLYAMLEETVESVTLTDTTIPPSLVRVIDAATSLAPWTKNKIVVEQTSVLETEMSLREGTAVLSSHGCGALTDQTLDLAIAMKGHVAVMPCCCHPKRPEAPEVMYRELGVKDGVDVDRTYRLNSAGYRVLWRYIPEDITPMNRIILGSRSA